MKIGDTVRVVPESRNGQKIFGKVGDAPGVIDRADEHEWDWVVDFGVGFGWALDESDLELVEAGE